MSASYLPVVDNTEGGEDPGPRLVINLKKSRPAQSGDGVFQTFATTYRPAEDDNQDTGVADPATGRKCASGALAWLDQALSLTPPPSSDATGLLGRWIHWSNATTDGYDTNYILSNWMRPVPWRIGQSATVDSAVDCFLHCVVAFEHTTSENIAKTHATNARALRKIRAACDADKSAVSGGDVLLAICLLFHVEV